MKVVNFGKTGKEVFILGLGTFGHGDAYGGIGKDNSLKVMQHIMNNILVNNIPSNAYFLIDTAPKYDSGNVEEWVGEFISNAERNNILIATKGGRHIEANRTNEKDFSSEFLRNDLTNSLRRLKTDKIFLYQLHNPSNDIIKKGEVFHLMESFRKEGKIEWYGVSIDKPEEGIAAIEYCEKNKLSGLAAIQVIYNVLQKNGLNALFESTKKHKIAIIARETLLRGFLADKYSENTNFENCSEAVKKEIKLFGKNQILYKLHEFKQILNKHNIKFMNQAAIKFVISNPNITLAIPGINRLEYVEPDLNSVNLALDLKLLEEINKMPDLEKLNL